MRPQPLLVAVLASLALASSAGAAPRPQITDAKADQVPVAGAGYDIVSALFRTEGTTTKVGRKKVYTPTKLVVTMTYAGPVPADAYATQVVTFNTATCSDVYLQSFSGGTWGEAGCVADPFDFMVKTSGSTVTFTVPFGVLGKKHFKKGVKLTDLRTYTAVADPVFGYETAELTGSAHGAGPVDSATTKSAYTIS